MSSESPSEALKGRLEWLDSLRALAAIWVVAHHAYLGHPFPASNPLLSQIGKFLAHGQLAVTAFIALSGFSLALPAIRRGYALRRGYGEFVLSRTIRIVPPYLIAIALALGVTLVHLTLLNQTLAPEECLRLGSATLKHVFLIQDLDGTNLIDLPGWSNGVLWTIAVEFKIYLLFPLVLWAIRKKGLSAGFALTLLFAAIFTFTPGLNMMRKPGFIVVFYLGLAACALAPKMPRKFAPLALLASLLTGLACFQMNPDTKQLPRDLAFGLAFALVLLSVGAWPDFKKALEWKPLAKTGESAYSLYLTHILVIQTIVKTLPFWRSSATLGSSLSLIFVSVALSLVVARLFYIPFERPFFNRRHRMA